ncbi:MAG: CrcB family protein [Halobacteriaceae archaeon]
MATDDRLLPVALLLVAGAAGATGRWLVSLGLPGRPGTLAANVAGAALLGLLVTRALSLRGASGRVELFAVTGFCSSFTTYSTFALGAFTALPWPGAGYVLVTYALGLAAAWLGRAAARRRWGRSG